MILIAAVARNGVIGRDGGMPWRLPGDLAHFREATWGKPVIMGRRTFESIGGPLPGRFTVVVSRRTDLRLPGVAIAGSPHEAIEQADAIGTSAGADSIMVAGGASLYAALMPVATSLLITAVDLASSGDTYFPAVDPEVWRVSESISAPRRAGDEASYAFLRYVRQSPLH